MKCWTSLYFQETLDKNRLELLPKFKLFKDLGFYLAWWTALALQFGHRQSIDFDFFINKDLDTKDLYDIILEKFKDDKIKKTFEEKNTLYIEINDVKLSFFTYDYDLLERHIDTEFMTIANFKDVWAMKLWAIQNRATNKDYVDLYFILKKTTLSDLFDMFYTKFWDWIVSKNHLLKSLVFFDDIIDEKLLMNHDISFKKVKKWLTKMVKDAVV